MLFCGNLQLPVTKGLLLAISLKLHGLIFAPVYSYRGDVRCYDLDSEV